MQVALQSKLKDDIDFNKFQNAIYSYLSNITLIDETTEDEFVHTIHSKLEYFMSKTNSESDIIRNKINILDSISYLIENAPTSNKQNLEEITKNEFSERYDELVSLLNNQTQEECTLILKTKSEKKPFKLFKNNEDSIIVKAGDETTAMHITKKKLYSIIFDNEIIDYYKSYIEVIIKIIRDNSFRTLLIENDTKQVDITNDKISKLEDERLKTNGKLKDLEDELSKYKQNFQELNLIQKNIKNIETDYSNAKESVLKEIKLQISYKFWESKGKSFNSNYWIYFGVSVVLSIALLYLVFDFMNHQDHKTIEIWKYGFLALSTTLSIWFIKILIKITLSNYHLSIDSQERVIMIRTYLALLKEGKSFAKEDKKIMLDNIFRPTNFGIIQDETSITIADIISSLKK